jgi:MFS family permease
MSTSEQATVPIRRVAVASCVGTTIEFYDFFIYGTAAALVFPKVFFPALGPAAGTVASFATFAVAFAARPLGAIMFGHYGDRIGRKRTLISTLLLMGIATVLIGLLPGAATIGVAAPIILVVLRFAQGFAVGGEWAGATLLTAEYAPAAKRGLYGVFPQLGPAIAFGLSSATFLVTGLVMGDTDEAFLSYGWRIPFLLSILLVGVGLYVRLSIEETPAFRAAQAAAPLDRPKRVPFLEAMRSQPREVLLSAGALTMLFAFFYMGTAYLTSYGTNPEGAALPRPVVLAIGVGAAVVFGITIAVAGVLSDRFGRRNVIMVSTAAGAVWALVLFPLHRRRPRLQPRGRAGRRGPTPARAGSRRRVRQLRDRRHALGDRGAVAGLHVGAGGDARRGDGGGEGHGDPGLTRSRLSPTRCAGRMPPWSSTRCPSTRAAASARRSPPPTTTRPGGTRPRPWPGSRSWPVTVRRWSSRSAPAGSPCRWRPPA